MKTIINFGLFVAALAVLGVTYRFAPVGDTFVTALLLGVIYGYIRLNRDVTESGSAVNRARGASEAARAGESESRLAA
jgi:hypothetical protein